jgi:excisionase family DNA binding protein
MPRPEYLTTREVADRFRVDPSTVRRWVEHHLITPSATTIGGHHRFTEADLAALRNETETEDHQ